MKRISIAAYVAVLTGLLAHGAEPQTIRSPLQAQNARKAAPALSLLDTAGKSVALSEYRGKVLLLDFWATECGGCRVEIPWFVALDQAYKDKGLAVVGVSMDILYEDLKSPKEAWNLVNPFVQTHHVSYRMLMGDDQATKLYDIQALPLTHLIDKRGRIAATYVGLANKDDVTANIRTLLTEH